MHYSERIRAILTPSELASFKKLSSPHKIQDYLDTLPMNFERRGETYMSPRRVLKAKTAHCFEGALLAAAALAYQGRKPLLLDLKTTLSDEEHVVALFKENGYWGAISKTNHAILRWRDPVYKNVRELAMSYFHEYFMWNTGKKSLRSYSASFNLARYKPEDWITAEEDLDEIAEALDKSRHFPAIPEKNKRLIRKASRIELRAMKVVEWTEPD